MKLPPPTAARADVGSVTLWLLPSPDIPVPALQGGAKTAWFEVKWLGSSTAFVCHAVVCTVTYLDPARSYQFAVRFHDPSGTGPWSDYSATAIASTPPSAPLAAHATASAAGELTISWSTALDSAPVTLFTVECDNGQRKDVIPGGYVVVFSGFAPGEAHQFRVTANNLAGSTSTGWFWGSAT